MKGYIEDRSSCFFFFFFFLPSLLNRENDSSIILTFFILVSLKMCFYGTTVNPFKHTSV